MLLQASASSVHSLLMIAERPSICDATSEMNASDLEHTHLCSFGMPETLPMFILDLFTEEEYLELGNVSGMPKEHKCVCSRSKAFIPEAASKIEGLFAIISKELIEEAETSSSIIQIYRRPRILLCSIGDAVPQETFYDPRVGVNVMSKPWQITLHLKNIAKVEHQKE